MRAGTQTSVRSGPLTAAGVATDGNRRKILSATSEGMLKASFLLRELRWLSGQALDAFRYRRVSGKQTAEAHSQQRLDDKQVRRRGRRHQGNSARVLVQLAQCACQSVWVPRVMGTAGIGLIFARTGNCQLDQQS